DPLERDAFFIGLGDAVMPTIMVASAATFLETPTVLGIEAAALGAIMGTALGLLLLLQMVMRGRAHAGLPLLNGGAIGGYVIAAILSGIPIVEAVGVGGFL
ncbi:MAG: presenilin family intramembrane aspartyl protease, partial [Halodesulfurarchaeum sp.]